MDKNKSRTDLLAAGRKKLQQFRQKKDGKGSGSSSSQGKSSKKSDKSEQHDANTVTVSAESGLTDSSHASGEEIQQQLDSNLVNVDSNELTSKDKIVATNSDGSTVDSLSVTISSASVIHDSHVNAELSAEGSGGLHVALSLSTDKELVLDSLPLKESEGSVPDESGVKRIASPVISEVVVSEEEGTHSDKLVPVHLHLPSLAVASTEEVAVINEKALLCEEEPREPQTDMPEMSLTSTRQDQGVKCSDSLKSSGVEPEVERNNPKSELGEGAETLSGTVLGETTMEQSICEADGEHFVVTESSVTGDEPEWISVSPVVSSDTGRFPDVDHEGFQGTNEATVRSSNEERSEAAAQVTMEQVVEGSEIHPQVEESLIADKSCSMPLETTMVSLSGEWPSSSGTDMKAITLMHLAELLKGLDENDFRFLFKSRDSAWLEQSKLQMDFDQEKCQQDNEVSVLGASLNEIRDRNQCLSDELAHCQSELLTVISEKKELQIQVHSAKAEIEELSSLVSDLQNKLERSQGEFSSLSMQLTDWKDMAQSLEMEKASLSGSISSMAEERQKLEEEKEQFVHENEKLFSELFETKGLLASLQLENSGLREGLAAVTMERKTLEGEKDSLVRENEKLSINLSEFHCLIETLQVDNSSVRETIALLTEEKRKLENEKDHSVLENDKLILELAKCNGLLDAANLETENVSGHLASMTMERSKLDEEKNNVICMNERLSSDLRAYEELLSVSRAEKLQLEADLREMNLHCNQIAEENIYLKNNLDIHKAKIQENSGDIQIPYQSGEVLDHLGDSSAACRGVEDAIYGADSCQGIGKHVGEHSSLELEKPLTDGSAVQLRGYVYDDCSGFVPFKAYLEEASKITQRFEKAIEQMHTYSEFLCQQGGKVSGAGISKLIQAFETKAQIDNPAMEEVLADGISATDPFLLAKEETEKLRAVLKQLVLHAGSAVDLYKGERDGRNLAQAAFQDIDGQYKVMRDHADSLEAMNIELEVRIEILKQRVHFVESKNREFKALYDSLQQREIILTAENETLVKKLSESLPRVTDLQYQLHRMKGTLDEMASLVSCQIQDLQKEAAEKALHLEHEWESFVAHISETVGKLDASSSRFFVAVTSANLQTDLDVAARIVFSVNAAVNVMDKLQRELEASRSECETVNNLHREANENFCQLHENYEVTVGTLHKIYNGLRELITHSLGHANESAAIIQTEESPVLNFNGYENIMAQLGDLVGERVQLVSENKQLSLDVMSLTQDVEELNRRCCNVDAILNSIEDAVKKDLEIDYNKPPLSRLEACIAFLLHRYKDADGKVNISGEEFQSRVVELNQMQEKIGQLYSLNFHHENEILSLKESLSKAEDALVNVQSDLQNKASELEQSEHRVSSVREKLSIAVAKGKGLISQRENLKQSLVEKSNELERCYQELQLKDSQLVEIEAKLKTYSEAGERVEALESELSYIRNSATALRESFLLKDSVLQRVEEILEDLELPEHFHSRDTIEKVDWLARSVAGNPLPLTDWDHKNSVDGGSHSDSGFVMDGWKEEAQSTSTDDLRKKYEDLQNKFYGLAEQNEMLEQSLMERNSVIQKWEEILGKVNIPSQLRSMEPESRIEWLATAVSDAHLHADSLKEKIGHLEGYCGKLSADLEESERRLSDVQAVLQSVADEKDDIYNNLMRITSDHAKVLEQATNQDHEKKVLENEINRLKQELVENSENVEENIHKIENRIRRMQDMIVDALQDPSLKDLVSVGSSFDCLEDLLRRLIDNYSSLSLSRDAPGNPITEQVNGSSVESGTDELLNAQMAESATLKKELEVTLSELTHLKDVRDAYMVKHQSLVGQVEALHKRVEELQELLTQEEQRSASVREKLNVAVRKGKSLVQQRDSLKQTIEEMNIKVERLSSESSEREVIFAEYEQKVKDFSTYPERLAALESENLLLRNNLTEANHYSQEKEHTLSMILGALHDIDVPGEFVGNPVKKLEQLGNLCHDLHVAVASADQESKKSRKAAELLLAELNEVQERNDHLQDELVKAGNDLFELSKSKEMAEAAKLEAFTRLEKLSIIHTEERKKQFAELMELKSVLDDLKKCLLDVSDILDNVLYMDSQFIKNLTPAVQSCLEPSDTRNMLGRSLVITSGGIENKENILVRDIMLDAEMQKHVDNNAVEVWNNIGDCLQGFTAKIDGMKEKLRKHVTLLYEESANISAVVEHVHAEMDSRAKSMEKEKGMENDALRKIITLLYEACFESIMEIENRKAHMQGNNSVMTGWEIDFRSLASVGRDEQELIFSEEHNRKLADRLLMVVKDVNGMEYDYLEKSQNEMKNTIASLQIELHEKDIQRERVCSVLVSQINEAEASAAIYSRDLQSAKSRIHDLEKQVELLEQEKNLAGQKVNELLTAEVTSLERQARVRSLTDLLAAKDQEIESLMQALDEEETQMEDMNKKVEVLEKALHQKNLDLENVEASRGKAVKKLSITVSKFDELHNLSASLLAEVENLQTQLHERDAEVSFLRQEVTRCTNDILAASQMSNKRSSEEILELFTWLEAMVSRVNLGEVRLDDVNDDQVHEHKHIIEKQITSMISELEDLRTVAQSKDALLQAERSRVEELKRKGEVLEESLHQKEAQLTLLHNARNSGQASSSMQSEILEVEPLINKWPAPGTSSASQVRSLRKGNNDQVAITVDDPSTSNSLEDEDDDKVHGFKSLTTSRIVPRFTRPVSDMIDGLWVSCDRALMRQPALRLGIIIYWAILHALLATFVV